MLLLCYYIIKEREKGIPNKNKVQGGTKAMARTKAEKEAKKAYKENLIKQGIDKEIAEVMAETFLEYGIIKSVVNGN